jgi:hypothetical protein
MTSAVAKARGIGFGVYIARISVNRLRGLIAAADCRPELIRDLRQKLRLAVAA